MKTDTTFLRSPFKAFFYAAKPFRFRLGLMWFVVVLGNICSYSVPYFLKVIADKMTDGNSILNTSFSDFYMIIFLVGTVTAGQEIFYRTGHYLETSIVVRMYDRIVTSLYELLLDRPVAYFEERFSGELARRVEQVGGSVKYFIEFFPWEMMWLTIATVMAIFLLSSTHIVLVLVFIVWFLLFSITSLLLLRPHFKRTEDVSSKQAELSGTIVDVMSNASLVQAFSAKGHEYKHYRRFMDSVINAENTERRFWMLNKFQQGVSVMALNLSLVITSVWLFSLGKVTVGDFVIVVATVSTFYGIIWNFGEIMLKVIRNFGEMKNALEALDTEVAPIREGADSLIVTDPTISFEKISFAYPKTKDKVFKDFSLDIKGGEKVGLVGRSGAGKSTIVKLLLHAYDVNKGDIYINGIKIDSVTLHSLRENISFVPQDTSLFHRTLYENVLYARPNASNEEVVNACKLAHAHDFIMTLSKGYDTLVGERGIKLSGGQRQRIALARAILKNAPILVFDEATSALDSESEAIVQSGLSALLQDKNKTVIAIAHRLSTLRSMDRIILLDEGKIIEDGSPSELLSREDSLFKKMWEQQKSGFIQ